MNLDLQLVPYIKTDSKRIEDLNVKAKDNKAFRRKYRIKFLRPGHDKNFLDITSKNTAQTRKVVRLNLIKILNLCTSNSNTGKVK